MGFHCLHRTTIAELRIFDYNSRSTSFYDLERLRLGIQDMNGLERLGTKDIQGLERLGTKHIVVLKG